MKFIGILLLLVAVVAIEASPQGDKINLDKITLIKPLAAYKCAVDDDCPRGYGCRCDEFSGVCISCRECKSDQACKDKYSNPESACKCTHNLCVGCVA